MNHKCAIAIRKSKAWWAQGLRLTDAELDPLEVYYDLWIIYEISIRNPHYRLYRTDIPTELHQLKLAQYLT